MSDPMMRSQKPDDYGPLFRKFEPPARPSTSQLAHDAARRAEPSRVVQILRVLRDRGPSSLFEIAASLQVLDHQLIEFTGERRRKPDTEATAEVYRITPDGLAHVAQHEASR